MNANGRQIGGSHYRKGGENQHWDFVEDNGLGYLEGCATKYVTRWRFKSGPQDLEKALHYLDKLIEKHQTRFRQPRGNASDGALEQFIRANDLNRTEGLIIEGIATWSTEADLLTARRLIQDMIDDPQDYEFI